MWNQVRITEQLNIFVSETSNFNHISFFGKVCLRIQGIDSSCWKLTKGNTWTIIQTKITTTDSHNNCTKWQSFVLKDNFKTLNYNNHVSYIPHNETNIKLPLLPMVHVHQSATWFYLAVLRRPVLLPNNDKKPIGLQKKFNISARGSTVHPNFKIQNSLVLKCFIL